MRIDPAGLARLVKTASLLTAVAGTGFSTSLCGIGLGGYLAGLVFEILFVGKDDWPPFPHARLVIVFLGSLVISVYVSDHLFVSLRGLWKYIEGFVLFYAGLDVARTKKAFALLAGALCLVAAASAADGIAQLVLGKDPVFFRPPVEYQTGIPRITGTFKHPNDYATFLIPGLALFASLGAWAFRGGRWREGLLAACGAALAGAAIVSSMSRAGLLAAFAALVVLVLFDRRRLWFAAALSAALSAAFLAPWPFGTRLREIFDWSAGNMPERLILLKTTWAMVRANPLFGLGLNTYSENFARFRPPDYSDVMYAHNSFLQMASEAGLVGLGLYLAVLAAFLAAALGAARRSPAGPVRAAAMGLAAGMAGFLANSLFESCFQSTRLRALFWLVAGLACAVAVHRLGEDREASP